MPAAEIGVSQVTDHRYVAPISHEPWERCAICGLGEAAHEKARGVYTPTARDWRCPDCVTADISCSHQGRR